MRKVAFYAGCFVNYYEPEIGKATVRVLEHNGVEIVLPPQVCCALPMVSKGNIGGAQRHMESNVASLSQALAEGCEYIVATCSSCSLMIKRSYPHFVPSEAARLVAEKTLHLSEYLNLLAEAGELKLDLRAMPETVFYHLPCHLRAQGPEVVNKSVDLLRLIPELAVAKIAGNCCGMGGTYGFEKRNFRLSRSISAKVVGDVKATPTDRVVTDCGLCKLQIETGAGVKVIHPVELLQEAYGLQPEG
ncbi:MAG: heterodisulfide reductase-related iron-sulfur binding cluster [Moorellales bacterium]